MTRKINYAALFTLRSDGRYMGFWHEPGKNGKKGPRHPIYDRDPERLYNRIHRCTAADEITQSTAESIAKTTFDATLK